MTTAPLKFKGLGSDDTLLFVDDAGGFFKSDAPFLDRYALGKLSEQDEQFLERSGHTFDGTCELDSTGFYYRWATRFYTPSDLEYVILVPTLQCNLSCGYCQVSRVNENTPGFDWNQETVDAVLGFLDSLTTEKIKVEFQGGEPLLALAHLQTVRDFCRNRFKQSEFVVCTNLQTVSEEAWQFLSSSDTFISTSLDGDLETHKRQRTIRAEQTEAFFNNLYQAVNNYPPGKVSALPTLDINALPDPKSIIQSFISFGLRSIYLRPVNHQGFARKRYDSKETAKAWNAFHARFVDEMIEYNSTAVKPIEEFYLTHCLRRIFRSGQDGHADLRNPNILGRSYIVIDYDGTFYPTDEARMVTRVGQLNLSMGNVREGMNKETIEALNAEASNTFHPDCIHCPYQPFCGVDLIDDLSRYGRIDLPKHVTDFCQRHTYMFDKAFELIYSDDPKIQKSLAIWLQIPEFDQDLAKYHQ